MSLAFFNAFYALAADNHLATDKAPVSGGIDTEFGLKGSTTTQAIERGTRLAVAEINAVGGVLPGWRGLNGGEFFEQAGSALKKVDLSILHTFNLFSTDLARVAWFMQRATLISKGNAQNLSSLLVEDIKSPAGSTHADDALHILATATNRASCTERSCIRATLENIPRHRGLFNDYAPVFTPSNYEALSKNELMMTQTRADGVSIP